MKTYISFCSKKGIQPSKNCLSRTFKALTLIELLVVIAIIAVLLALIYPVVQSSIASARQAGCLSNMRTLTQAALHWKNENGVYLPPDAMVGISRGWYEELFKFIYPDNAIPNLGPSVGGDILKDTVFYCPSYESNPGYSHPRSYGYNATVWHWNSRNPRYFHITLSKLVMFGDVRNSSRLRYDQLNPRHQGALNLSFYDGHVEKRKVADIPSREETEFWRGYK